MVIIEDERDVARLLEFNLRGAGFTVASAATGAAGLDEVRRARTDVVVLDLMLPDQSGYEVCKQIRADPAVGDAGVLMLTARGEAEDRILGLEVGADDYVVNRSWSTRSCAGHRAGQPARRAPHPAGGEQARRVLKVGPISSIDHPDVGSTARAQLRPLSTSCCSWQRPGPGVLARGAARAGLEMRGDINTRTVDVRPPVAGQPEQRRRVIETVHGFGYRARRSSQP